MKFRRRTRDRESNENRAAKQPRQDGQDNNYKEIPKDNAALEQYYKVII